MNERGEFELVICQREVAAVGCQAEVFGVLGYRQRHAMLELRGIDGMTELDGRHERLWYECANRIP